MSEEKREYAFPDDIRFWKGVAERLVRHAHRLVLNTPKSNRRPLWAVVSDLTAHGSTFSKDLCRYFGFDPDIQ